MDFISIAHLRAANEENLDTLRWDKMGYLGLLTACLVLRLLVESILTALKAQSKLYPDAIWGHVAHPLNHVM